MGSSVTDKDDVIFREVRRDGLYYRFYPFHIFIHRIACEDINGKFIFLNTFYQSCRATFLLAVAVQKTLFALGEMASHC